MPKTVYVFRGGPLNGKVRIKDNPGRCPSFAYGNGERLRRATAQSHFRKGAGFYLRSREPEIVGNDFAYVFVWSKDLKPSTMIGVVKP
jgi:hypothetical protein